MRTFDRPTPSVTGERPGPVNPIGRWPAQLYVAIERVGTGPTWDDMIHVWANGTIIGETLEAVVLSDNPIVYLPFQGDGVDATGNGFDATLTGSPIYDTDLTAPGGQALLLNGSSQYASTPDGVQFFLGGATWEAWVNKTTGSGTGQYSIMAVVDDAWPYAPCCLDTGGANKFRSFQHGSLGATVYLEVSDTPTITTGVWVYLAATYNPSGPVQSFYVNGVLVGTDTTPTGSVDSGFHPLHVGWFATPSPRYWPGKVAHVAVYASVLSAARIAAHYSAGTT